MRKIEILPLKWVIITSLLSKKEIFFEMTKEDIIARMWNPSDIEKNAYAKYNIFYYFENNLQLCFTVGTDKLEYIEIVHDIMDTEIFGKQIFKLEAQKVIDELSQSYEINKNDPELWYSYGSRVVVC